MSERRRSPRSRCLVGAKVVFGNQRLVLSCMARNITPDGCMLVFGEDPFIPNQIDVLISNRKDMVPAEVIWRDGQRVGVAFHQSKA